MTDVLCHLCLSILYTNTQAKVPFKRFNFSLCVFWTCLNNALYCKHQRSRDMQVSHRCSCLELLERLVLPQCMHNKLGPRRWLTCIGSFIPTHHWFLYVSKYWIGEYLSLFLNELYKLCERDWAVGLQLLLHLSLPIVLQLIGQFHNNGL